MIVLAFVLVAVPAALLSYTYLLYPLFLRLLAADRERLPTELPPGDEPSVTLLMVAYNEAEAIGQTLEALLALDYPADRRQILVMSDASSDGTDDIVRRYASRGVELIVMPNRAGKTAAENASVQSCRGAIVVRVDATVTIPAGALRPLVAAFHDPTVGVASGRDVSIGAAGGGSNDGEGGYVGFEMRLRGLETRFVSIVGASGCFFAVRRALHEPDSPLHLSTDFSTPLRAWRRGYRSVSVDEAICYVRRTPSLLAEYRRKVRTMSRGLQTLWNERDLLDLRQHGRFAFVLWSHKLIRWLTFLLWPLAFPGIALLATQFVAARALLVAAVIGLAVGLLALRWPPHLMMPRVVAVTGFVVASHIAGFAAWVQALRGPAAPTWEPTRRQSVA